VVEPDAEVPWLEEHTKDDHMVTLDHKDEMDLCERLLTIREALLPEGE